MRGPIVLRSVLLVLLTLLAFAPSAARAAPPLTPPLEESIADGDIDAEDLVARGTVGRGALRSAPGGHAWLSLAGYRRASLTGQSELGAFLVVGLPLDRFARVAARASAGVAGAGSPVNAGVAAVAGAGPSANVVPGPFDEPAIGVTPRLARATVEAAWRIAGLSRDDARLDAIVARARWSAVLPETRLRAIRYDDERLYTESSVETSRLRDSAGANVGLEARLTWRLDRLLYADDEPSFERMRLERHDARSRIAARVLEALFHWHRAWLELRWAQAASREAREAPNRPSREEVESTLRVLEAEATLDVLTSGWFTSSRARLALSRPPATAPSIPEAL